MRQVRLSLELTLPGFLIGIVGGALAGGIAAFAGLSTGYSLAMMLTLGVPLGVFGMGYNVLLAMGRLRLGGVAPAALYWLFAFPLARLANEMLFDVVSGRPVVLPDDVVPFLTYQAILSVGYAIGFVWMHEYVFSYWWIKVRDHNPVAARYVEQYGRQAYTMEGQKEAQKGRRPRKLKSER